MRKALRQLFVISVIVVDCCLAENGIYIFGDSNEKLKLAEHNAEGQGEDIDYKPALVNKDLYDLI